MMFAFVFLPNVNKYRRRFYNWLVRIFNGTVMTVRFLFWRGAPRKIALQTNELLCTFHFYLLFVCEKDKAFAVNTPKVTRNLPTKSLQIKNASKVRQSKQIRSDTNKI